MRFLLTVSTLCLTLFGSAQSFRFGWRDDIVSLRNAESLSASAVDSLGNLVVAGTIQLPGNQVDVLVRKYDPLGVKIWEQRIDIGGNKLTDWVQSVLISQKNEIYVSAGTPKNGFDNFALIKLAAQDGKVIFQNILDTGTKRASVAGAVIDPASGSVVQVGGFGSNAREELFAVKWSESGAVEWKKNWTNGARGDRAARAVAVAPGGDIVVSGYCATEKTGQDSVALRFSSSGDLRWVRTFPGGDFPANDGAHCVAADSVGNVYVGGDEYVAGSRNSAYVAKLSGADGSVSWKTNVLEPRGMDGVTLALAPVADGVIAGVQMDPTSADRMDIAAIKFSLAGKEVWRAVVNGAPGTVEALSGMVVDRYGHIYLTGGSMGADRVSKYLAACVNSGGKIVWQHRDSGEFSGLPARIAVADDSGHVFVSGARSRGVDDDLSVLTIFQAPRAANDRYRVFEGELLTVSKGQGVLANDIFWRFATLKLSSPAKSGVLALAADGSFTFQAPAAAGDVTFGYELVREGLSTATGTVSISVVKKPKPPGN